MRRTNHAAVITSCAALCAAMLFGIAAAPVAAHPQAKHVPQPAAILTVISGDVLLRTAQGGFSSAMDGAVLYVGAMLRTSADARALITLFEGSTVALEPASDITIEDATMRSGSTIAQALGRSWHVVTHLTAADSRYELTTPAATASVRGGEFEVAATDGITGPTMTMTTLESRAPTTVVVPSTVVLPTSARVETSVQATASLAQAAPVSTRSAAVAERIRTVMTQTLAARALSAARDRDRDGSGDRTGDRDDERDED